MGLCIPRNPPRVPGNYERIQWEERQRHTERCYGVHIAPPEEKCFEALSCVAYRVELSPSVSHKDEGSCDVSE